MLSFISVISSCMSNSVACMNVIKWWNYLLYLRIQVQCRLGNTLIRTTKFQVLSSLSRISYRNNRLQTVNILNFINCTLGKVHKSALSLVLNAIQLRFSLEKNRRSIKIRPKVFKIIFNLIKISIKLHISYTALIFDSFRWLSIAQATFQRYQFRLIVWIIE